VELRAREHSQQAANLRGAQEFWEEDFAELPGSWLASDPVHGSNARGCS
jgi:hypothetical protein